MALLIFIVLAVIIAVELFFLVKLTQILGGAVVLGMIIITALLGIGLLRILGKKNIVQILLFDIWHRRITLPFLLRDMGPLLSGLFLLIPGPITDLIGLFLFANWLVDRRRPSQCPPEVIDIDYKVHDD
ncbi:FxsA family protein [Candidatus Bipolaricaulota bacterium]|nr:FxsA family protein [Candidatus Bipolaricaulota bacterium]